MLKIDEIQNGIVIDHIKAGTCMHLYDRTRHIRAEHLVHPSA